MKFFSIVFSAVLTTAFVLCSGHTANAQKTNDDKIKEVLEIVHELQFSYHGYQSEYETYNWEEEEIIPELSEEEKESEYNEFGNYTAEKRSYHDESGELVLISIDDSYQYYQENRLVSRERYYFFSEGKLICFQESVLDEHYHSDEMKIRKKEILLYNDEIIYYDYTTFSDDEMAEAKTKPVSELTSEDIKGLRDYDTLYPDW